MVYALIGGIEAILAGSIVGVMYGLALQAKMMKVLISNSVWEPCTTRDISACQPGYLLFGGLSMCSCSYCLPSRFKAVFNRVLDSDAPSDLISD